MTDMTLDEAIAAALKLNQQVEKQGTNAVFDNLEKAVVEFHNEGYPLESIMPQGSAAALGFSLRAVDGKSFFDVYAGLVREKLCATDGEFNKLIKSGIHSSVGAVLTAIVTALGIPGIALGIMIPMAVLIANTGLDAFCEVTKDR